MKIVTVLLAGVLLSGCAFSLHYGVDFRTSVDKQVTQGR